MSLKELIQAHIVRFQQPVTLSGGQASHAYFDMKGLMLDHEANKKLLYEVIPRLKYRLTGGVELGGAMLTMLLSAVTTSGKYFIIRKQQKTHGLKNRLVGVDDMFASDLYGEEVTIVEDVITTGKTVEEAKALLERHGAKVKQIICIVDRTPDGRYESLFKEKDFDYL
jgi:orotate phosphoribosyltransferase